MSFEDREDAFEKKYAHDQEIMFKVEARTCKIFGLWIAEKLGLSGADADNYAKTVVAANLQEAGFDDVKRKIIPDLQEKGIEISEAEIDARLDKDLKDAKKQIMEEQRA